EELVGGPVADPEALLDWDRAEALLHDPDHRDRPRHGGLEAELGAPLARRRHQLRAVLGEQPLVGGPPMPAVLERPGDVLQRGLHAADQLDDDLAARQDPVEVSALAAEDAAHPGPPPRALRAHARALLEQPAEGAPDGTPPENADVDGGAH